MNILHSTDNLFANIIQGVGVFTIYAGMVSGMYVTIQSIRAMDYKNITIYALMTGGLFYCLPHILTKNQGPLSDLAGPAGLISFIYPEDDGYDAEWIQ